MLVFTIIVFLMKLVWSQCTPFCTCNKVTQTCTSCMSNYHKNTTFNECVYKRDLGCEKYASQSSDVCQKCSDGYKFNYLSGVCEVGIEHCLDATLSLEGCSSCEENYYSAGLNGCLQSTSEYQYCTSIDSENNCEFCVSGALLSEGRCVMYDEFCATSTTANSPVCKTCYSGFFVNSEGKCQSGEIANCMKYTSKTDCSMCLTGYRLLDNKCEKDDKCVGFIAGLCLGCPKGYFVSQKACFPCGENCESCTSSTKCKICYEGFAVQNGVCEKCEVLNCTKCDESGKMCEICENGYSLFEGKCVRCVNHCDKCRDVLSCETCESGYIAVDGGCAECEILNCLKCTEGVDQCNGCASGYSLQDNYCFKTIKNCKTYSEDGMCKVCNTNYIFDETDSTKCIRKPCSVEGDGGNCTTCSLGYYKTEDSSCEKCSSKCSAGCTMRENECDLLIEKRSLEGCAIYEKDGKCAICKEDYKLNKGKCENKGIACAIGSYTKTNKCTTCFSLLRGYTMPVDYNCWDGSINEVIIMGIIIILLLV
ncbi:hypothetical protein EIN_508680 [Entamoeba invadens IP1]|uniref:EGF-like domain-containing protein n=1 Tax=Entamoeba invadens IP1 TaxID=370355 RepID=A0A0A1UCA4_ENTIV|nr:hypothetical protein EIN_508680 [Entamoeba invadens IP1]ELP92867.1 hypothetical protein EIN_508680 [Entamoeba invadens IP1]|eukprot:XP_004259638.1 hypothetical protein EIN_508680 [Entamoeba invadens IP1]